MSHYISQFDVGEDFQQPHNFVLINGERPVFNFLLEYYEQPNYKMQYQWMNASQFGLGESFFDSILTKRDFQNATETTVIINSSTAKLRMEFMKKDLSMNTGSANSRQPLKTSLLILDPFSEKPVRFFNLTDESGDLSLTFASRRKFILNLI